LALLQETLAEARALVELHGRCHRQDEVRGLNSRQIDERFEKESDEAKRFAYGIAKEIKDEQELTVLILAHYDVRQTASKM